VLHGGQRLLTEATMFEGRQVTPAPADLRFHSRRDGACTPLCFLEKMNKFCCSFAPQALKKRFFHCTPFWGHSWKRSWATVVAPLKKKIFFYLGGLVREEGAHSTPRSLPPGEGWVHSKKIFFLFRRAIAPRGAHSTPRSLPPGEGWGSDFIP
jgi:hypothetical protein